MNTQNKKILVTGGGRGIGLSIAKAFAAQKGNQLILVGRSEETLKTAITKVPNSSYIVGDVSDEKDVENIVRVVKELHGGLDILVNNAGVGSPKPLVNSTDIVTTARYEMEINYFSVLRLTEQLLPILQKSKEAAIINIESIVSYAPNVNIATYSATKAALHSYSQSLRWALQKEGSQVKIFEVFPPFVDTDLTKGFEADKLSPDEVAKDIIEALEKNEYAIRNGGTKDLYQLFRQSPEEALKALNPA